MDSDLVTMAANSMHRHDQSVQRIQHLEPADMCSPLELCRWIKSNSHMIRNIFLLTMLILPAMESIVQETPIYGIVIFLTELSKATTNIAFQ